jgi:hypothetical protein
MLMSVVQIHLSPPNTKSLLALLAGIFFALICVISLYHAGKQGVDSQLNTVTTI